jgi:hypothetical protein
MHKQVAGILLITCSYAVIRYAGFGGVAPIHIPGLLVNKGFCLAACLALAFSATALFRSRMDQFLYWGRAAGQLAFVHVLLALALLSKGNYPKFFAGEQMNLTGEVVLLTGALAAYCFWRLEQNGLLSKVRCHLLSLVSGLTAIHLFVMGYAGWLQPAKWHGGLPPITLLSFLCVTYSLIIFLLYPEKQDAMAVDKQHTPPA